MHWNPSSSWSSSTHVPPLWQGCVSHFGTLSVNGVNVAIKHSKMLWRSPWYEGLKFHSKNPWEKSDRDWVKEIMAISSRLIPTHSIIHCVSIKIVCLAWSPCRSTNNLRQFTFYKSFLNEILIIFGWIQDGGHLWNDVITCSSIAITYKSKRPYRLEWSLTIIEPPRVSFEKRSWHIYFLEEKLLHAISK